MSFDEKIKHLQKITDEEACQVIHEEFGWTINSVEISTDEFPQLFMTILNDPSEKKRTNALIILRKIGADVISLLPDFTKTILLKWYKESKFLQNYLNTFFAIVGDIRQFIDNTTSIQIIADLGSVFEIVKHYDLSILCWHKILKIQSDFFFASVRLSYCYYFLGNISGALQMLWEGIKNQQFDIPTGYFQGKLDPKYKQDIETLVELLEKKEKNNYMIFYLKGLIAHHFYKDNVTAINLFIKSLRINNTFIEAQYKLANSFGLVGDKENLMKTYHRILQTDSKQIRALQIMGSIYRDLKDNATAVSYYEQLNAIEPNNPFWLRELATLYRTSVLLPSSKSIKPWNRDLDKAFIYYQKLIALEPKNSSYTEEFYNLLTEMRKFEEAKDLLFNYLIYHGNDQVMMRRLESLYTWLKLPFDEQKIKQDLNYYRNKDSAYPKILELLSSVRPNIPITLPRIAQFVDFPIDKMELLLKKLVEDNPALGEYLELEQVFIRKENTDTILHDLKVRYSTCYYCGMPIDSLELTDCPTCNKEILKCSVCKLPISFGEEIGFCSLCDSKGHLHHLEEWVKTQGKCPTCLQELPLHGVVPFEEPLKMKK